MDGSVTERKDSPTNDAASKVVIGDTHLLPVSTTITRETKSSVFGGITKAIGEFCTTTLDSAKHAAGIGEAEESGAASKKLLPTTYADPILRANGSTFFKVAASINTIMRNTKIQSARETDGSAKGSTNGWDSRNVGYTKTEDLLQFISKGISTAYETLTGSSAVKGAAFGTDMETNMTEVKAFFEKCSGNSVTCIPAAAIGTMLYVVGRALASIVSAATTVGQMALDLTLAVTSKLTSLIIGAIVHFTVFAVKEGVVPAAKFVANKAVVAWNVVKEPLAKTGVFVKKYVAKPIAMLVLGSIAVGVGVPVVVTAGVVAAPIYGILKAVRALKEYEFGGEKALAQEKAGNADLKKAAQMANMLRLPGAVSKESDAHTTNVYLDASSHMPHVAQSADRMLEITNARALGSVPTSTKARARQEIKDTFGLKALRSGGIDYKDAAHRSDVANFLADPATTSDMIQHRLMRYEPNITQAQATQYGLTLSEAKDAVRAAHMTRLTASQAVILAKADETPATDETVRRAETVSRALADSDDQLLRIVSKQTANGLKAAVRGNVDGDDSTYTLNGDEVEAKEVANLAQSLAVYTFFYTEAQGEIEAVQAYEDALADKGAHSFIRFLELDAAKGDEAKHDAVDLTAFADASFKGDNHPSVDQIDQNLVDAHTAYKEQMGALSQLGSNIAHKAGRFGSTVKGGAGYLGSSVSSGFHRATTSANKLDAELLTREILEDGFVMLDLSQTDIQRALQSADVRADVRVVLTGTGDKASAFAQIIGAEVGRLDDIIATKEFERREAATQKSDLAELITPQSSWMSRLFGRSQGAVLKAQQSGSMSRVYVGIPTPPEEITALIATMFDGEEPKFQTSDFDVHVLTEALKDDICFKAVKTLVEEPKSYTVTAINMAVEQALERAAEQAKFVETQPAASQFKSVFSRPTSPFEHIETGDVEGYEAYSQQNLFSTGPLQMDVLGAVEHSLSGPSIAHDLQFLAVDEDEETLGSIPEYNSKPFQVGSGAAFLSVDEDEFTPGTNLAMPATDADLFGPNPFAALQVNVDSVIATVNDSGTRINFDQVSKVNAELLIRNTQRLAADIQQVINSVGDGSAQEKIETLLLQAQTDKIESLQAQLSRKIGTFKAIDAGTLALLRGTSRTATTRDLVDLLYKHGVDFNAEKLGSAFDTNDAFTTLAYAATSAAAEPTQNLGDSDPRAALNEELFTQVGEISTGVVNV